MTLSYSTAIFLASFVLPWLTLLGIGAHLTLKGWE